MSLIDVKIKQLHPNAVIPTYAHEGDAGADLYSIERVVINPNETKVIRTGLSIELPKGYEWQIRPRSGMSLKVQLMVSNSPGTVDERYRGEVGVIMFNPTPNTIKIDKGTRIAQAVLKEVPRANFIVVNELTTTERGDGGFGSTGEKELNKKSNALPSFDEIRSISAEEDKDIQEVKDIVEEAEEVVESVAEIVEVSTTTDPTEVVPNVEDIDSTEPISNEVTSKEEEKKVHNVVTVYNSKGEHEGIVSADTQTITESEDIKKSVEEFQEEAKEVIEESKNEVSSVETVQPEEEAYNKYGPMFDQAVESFCKDEDNKAMYDLACETVDKEDLKIRLIMKIVENQLNGVKTVVVNELKEILEIVLK